MSEMAAAATETPTTPAEPAATSQAQEGMRIRRITVAEYYRMGDAGIFGPEERVELLDGMLFEIPPMSPEHAYAVSRLTTAFVQRFADRAWVSAQNPIALDEISEPQPDLMLSELPAERYAKTHPTPNEAMLVVEVALSSLKFDLGSKLCAYARRGVREYWIVDLVNERVEVFRDPGGERYRVHLSAGRGESVAPLAFPNELLLVDEFLPPAE
jgi:Uma2 family endonuclease